MTTARQARLFSFKGRTSRLGFWRGFLMLQILAAIAFALTSWVAITAGWWAAAPALLLAAPLVGSLALNVTRLHDRNKSGWWLLIFSATPLLLVGVAELALRQPGPTTDLVAAGATLAGLALWLWGWIEIGFLGSRPGPNRYEPTA